MIEYILLIVQMAILGLAILWLNKDINERGFERKVYWIWIICSVFALFFLGILGVLTAVFVYYLWSRLYEKDRRNKLVSREAEQEKSEETSDNQRRRPRWYHYIELFLIQGPILFPAIVLDVSGPWRNALTEVTIIEMGWLIAGLALIRFVSKWIGLLVIGWALIAIADYLFLGERAIRR